MGPGTPSSSDESASFHPRTAHGRILTFLRGRAPFRLLSTRAPRQSWLRASSWLAPSLRRRLLRPGGVEGARCFSTTAATQSNCVHPHLACSRFRATVSCRGSAWSLGLRAAVTGGPRGSRPSCPLRRTVLDTNPVLYCLAAWSHGRGRFLPTAPKIDRASDVPVAEPCSPSASPAFAGAACFAERPPRGGVARVGECTLGQDRRSHALVKERASSRSRTPSIGRDPS